MRDATSWIVALALMTACGPDRDPLDSVSQATAASQGSEQSSDPSGGPGGTTTGVPTTGDPTDGSATGSGTSGTTGGAPGMQANVCVDYLACIAATDPAALPNLVDAYGPNGSCWEGDQALADQCSMACQTGLTNAGQAFPDEPLCCPGLDCGGSTTNTTSTTDPVDCPDPPGLPNDSSCTDASGCGCASGKCFVVPALGGFCGECLTDADCPAGGCTPPNPIQQFGAVCNTGQPGDGCMSDAVCLNPAAPNCAEILSIPGIITVSTCSQCSSNADCGAQAPNCAPEYGIADFTGQLKCKANGSVPLGGGCALAGDGGKVCASGHCGEASVMGLLQLGICSECETDADCGGGTCDPPQIDLGSGTIIPGQCF